jgi:ketosteroid isomerase-like protein
LNRDDIQNGKAREKYSTCGWRTPLLAVVAVLVSCTGETQLQTDLVHDQFPEAQAELRAVVESIVRDATTADIEGLRSIHLESDKFTKFGPRSFDRQNVASTNASETAFWGSVSVTELETRDLKVDVFGEVGVVTSYTHLSFVQEGERKNASGRQTLVFLRTADGWKIVHEHGSSRPQ